MTTIPSALDPSIARSTTDGAGGVYTATVPGRPTPSGELGKDAFLKLLVAQMKYQDPMNPADGTEFVAQTAQFTMVENLVALAAQNDKILQSQQSLTASTFIGRDVQWAEKDETGAEVDHAGTVTGVKFTPDGPMLRVGDEDIPLSAVKGLAPVATPPATPPADETSTTTDGDPNGTDAAQQPDPTD